MYTDHSQTGKTCARIPRWRTVEARLRGPLLAMVIAAIATGALATPALASSPPSASGSYAFKTLDNQKDPTFNQLLGINSFGVIAGYFGSGQGSHPNKGYVLSPHYGPASYKNENFPGSAQTQVTGLNNFGTTVGFWVDGKGNSSGFYAYRHRFHTANFPTGDNAKPRVDQLLGVNDHGVAAGFYTDSHGTNHGYTYTTSGHRFRSIMVPGDSNVTVAAINNLNDLAGFATKSGGATEAFLKANGMTFHLAFPGASSTQALGVNNGDEVVGDYTVGSGSNAPMHGFIWAPGLGFATVDDPSGVGATTINGINNHDELVGFYADSTGNTHGFLAKPMS